MAGDIIVLFLALFVVAALAFAPLGYFIYKFQGNNAKLLGETEAHGDSPSSHQ